MIAALRAADWSAQQLHQITERMAPISFTVTRAFSTTSEVICDETLIACIAVIVQNGVLPISASFGLFQKSKPNPWSFFLPA